VRQVVTPAVRKVERAVESQEGTLARRLDERLMRAKGGQIASWTGAMRACSWVGNISAAARSKMRTDASGVEVVEARLEDL
jgi:hypothetical protein